MGVKSIFDADLELLHWWGPASVGAWFDVEFTTTKVKIGAACTGGSVVNASITGRGVLVADVNGATAVVAVIAARGVLSAQAAGVAILQANIAARGYMVAQAGGAVVLYAHAVGVNVGVIVVQISGNAAGVALLTAAMRAKIGRAINGQYSTLTAPVAVVNEAQQNTSANTSALGDLLVTYEKNGPAVIVENRKLEH